MTVVILYCLILLKIRIIIHYWIMLICWIIMWYTNLVQSMIKIVPILTLKTRHLPRFYPTIWLIMKKISIYILLIFMQEQKIIKFFQKNIWSVRKMVVLLHPLSTEKQEWFETDEKIEIACVSHPVKGQGGGHEDESIKVKEQFLQWRVWSWLRMNASGRLNTCKSRGNAR